LGLRVNRFRVQELRIRVQSSEFQCVKVLGLRVGVQAPGYRIWGNAS